MEKSSRIEWVDISKFIAISIMVAGHLGVPSKISIVIHMFHMPVFFIMAGFFFSIQKHSSILKFTLSRFKSLLIPYFVWGGISYIVYRLMMPPSDNTVSVKEFLIAIISQDANVSAFSGYGVIQWFFTALFFSEIGLWFLVKIKQTIKKECSFRHFDLLYTCIVLIILVIINVVICRYVEKNILGIKSALLGVLFCYLGYEGKKVLDTIYFKKVSVQLSLMLVAMITFGAIYIINGHVNMRTAQYNNSVLFIIGAISGSLIVFILSNIISTITSLTIFRKYALYIGRNTALILCTNRIVQCSLIALLNMLIQAFIPIDTGIGLYICQLIGFIAEMLLFVPVIYVVNRWLPFTIGKSVKKVETTKSL